MKRLGVLGTLVWDRIWHPAGGDEPLEQWGGIAYSLSAAAAACPPGWEIQPIVRVGRDLSAAAADFVRGLPHLAAGFALTVVPQPNNRVELHYLDDAERTETLSGGVSGWSWAELEPALDGLDALYVNFISGYEMELATAERLRTLDIPTYADLHSLFLGEPGEGARAPRRLPEWERWFAAFDAVQLNEPELRLTGPAGDPRVAGPAKGEGDLPARLATLALVPAAPPALVLVTRGRSGAAFGRLSHPDGRGAWQHARRAEADATVETDFVPTEHRHETGDPTGCGDIWGAVLVCRLLAGDDVVPAIRTAHAAAAARLVTPRIVDLPARIAAALAQEADPK